MNLSKREQFYALIAGAILLAGIVYFYLLSPYLASRAQLITDIKTAQDKVDHEQQLLDGQPKVAADWKSLLAGNLKTVPAQAISQTHDAFYDAAHSARFDLQTVNPDRPRQEGDFQVIRLNVTGTGSTASFYRFVSALENSNLPLKIEDMRINARHPGADDLNIALTITTVIFAPNTTSRPSAQPQGDTL